MFTDTKVKNIFKLVFLSVLLAVVILPQAAAAKTARERCDEFIQQFQITSDNGDIESGNLVAGLPDFCTAENLLLTAIKIALTLAGSVAVLFIIVGGFWYLTSGGNEEQAEKGKKTLINSVIGLVIIVMSFAIVRIVANTLSSSSGGGGTSQNQSNQTGGGTSGQGGGSGDFGSGNLSQQELTQAAAALSGNIQISDQGSGNFKVSAFLYNNADADNVNKLCAVQSPTAGGIRVMFKGSQVASQAFAKQGPTTYKAEVTARVSESGLMQVYICNVPITEQQVSAGGG